MPTCYIAFFCVYNNKGIAYGIGKGFDLRGLSRGTMTTHVMYS